jgi:hypothetical protein
MPLKAPAGKRPPISKKNWKSIEHTIERCNFNAEDETKKDEFWGWRTQGNVGMMEQWGIGFLRIRIMDEWSTGIDRQH